MRSTLATLSRIAILLALGLAAGPARAVPRLWLLDGDTTPTSATSVVVAPDGSLFVLLGVGPYPARQVVARLSPAGTVEAAVEIAPGIETRLSVMLAAPTGGVVLAGGYRARTTGDMYDALALQLDRDLAVRWQAGWGADTQSEIIRDGQPTSDGGWLFPAPPATAPRCSCAATPTAAWRGCPPCATRPPGTSSPGTC